jgi:hypothetical protein
MTPTRPPRVHTLRRRTILALVFVVAAAVLAESWHAAMNAAATGGRPWPWLWPVTLEAFIFVLVLVYWDARSAGQRARTARVFLFLTTAVASAVQILDAPPTWLGWVTAGWTPVALLCSVEFAVGRLYRPAWGPIPDPPDPSAQPDPDPDQEPDQPPAETRPRVAQDAPRRGRPATLGGPAFTPAQAAQVERWVAEGRTNKSEMARQLGLSDRGRRQLGTLVDALQAQRPKVDHPNGQGSGS